MKHIEFLTHKPVVWTPSHQLGYPLLAVTTALLVFLLIGQFYSTVRYCRSNNSQHHRHVMRYGLLAQQCGTGALLLGVVCALYDIVFGVGRNPVPNNDVTVLVLVTATTLEPLLWGAILMLTGWIVNNGSMFILGGLRLRRVGRRRDACMKDL